MALQPSRVGPRPLPRALALLHPFGGGRLGRGRRSGLRRAATGPGQRVVVPLRRIPPLRPPVLGIGPFLRDLLPRPGVATRVPGATVRLASSRLFAVVPSLVVGATPAPAGPTRVPHLRLAVPRGGPTPVRAARRSPPNPGVPAPPVPAIIVASLPGPKPGAASPRARASTPAGTVAASRVPAIGSHGARALCFPASSLPAARHCRRPGAAGAYGPPLVSPRSPRPRRHAIARGLEPRSPHTPHS